MFEGDLTIRGGKNIKIGRGVFVGKGVTLVAVKSGTIEIKDGCSLLSGIELRAVDGKIEIGRGCTLNKSATIKTADVNFTGRARVTLGDNVWVGQNSILEGEDIELGDEVILAPFVHIMSNDHQRDLALKKIDLTKTVKSRPVRLKRNCWIGSGTRILKGVEIGECAIVGAGSVVTHSVEDLQTVAGVPARPLSV
ncbi:MAG: acyltransferase [Candidatus Omnitrophica bacterium]|nr:acyltransferase [Candidatus Omnitrophota bacterium]